VAGIAPEVPRVLVGRYRLVRLLARGGMAEVWEGRDDVLSRPVAVKMLLPHLAADPYLQERFKREAVTAARLVHPGIVAVFDAGTETLAGSAAGAGPLPGRPLDGQARPDLVVPADIGRAFIVMELVPGETLRDLMARSGPLTPRVALAIASQVTDALAYAHAQGLVHRDIKPANVLLRDEGNDMVRVKVADFGIAKAAASAGDLTANGALLGTPKYISPEQVQGREPDARADLYSVGIVIFEMLAGHPPFQAGTDMATAIAHVEQAAPALDLACPGLPTPLADLVGSLLMKDPGARTPSASALGARLALVSREMGLPVSQPGAFLRLDRPQQGHGTLHLEPATSSETSPARAPIVAARTVGLQSGATAGGATAGGATAGGATAGGATAGGATAGGATAGGATAGGATAGPGLPAGTAQQLRRHGRVASGVVGLVFLLGLLTAVDLFGARGPATQLQGPGGPSGVQSAGTTGHFRSLRIVRVSELAQGGNLPNDNVDELKNTIGADRSAYWQSDLYEGPDFGGYGGLGLVLQLAAPRVLHELVVQTPMRDWSAEVFVGHTDAPTLSGWGTAVERRTGINGDAVFPLGGRRGSWVLFWMLNPGPTDQATVDKLSVS